MARLINIPKDVQVLIDAEERGDTLGPKAQAFLNQMRDKDLIRPIDPLENPNLARRNQPSGLSGFLGLDQPASGAEALGRFASDPENIEAGGKLAAEIGGSIGGLKGLGKLFPKSKFTAPVVGETGGATAGNIGFQGLDALVGKEKPIEQRLGEISETAKFNLGFSSITRGGLKFLDGFRLVPKGSFLPDAKIAKEVLGSRPTSPQILPGQATDFKPAEIVQNIVDASLTTDIVGKRKGAVTKETLRLIEKFHQKFVTGVSDETLTKTLKDLLIGKGEAFRRFTVDAIEGISASMINKNADPVTLMIGISDILKKTRNPRLKLFPSRISLTDVADLLVGKSGNLTNSEKSNLVKKVLAKARLMDNNLKSAGLNTNYEGALEEIFEGSSKLGIPGLKQKGDVFTKDFLNTIAKVKPSNLADFLGRSNNPELTKAARELLDDPSLWKNIQERFVSNMLRIGGKTAPEGGSIILSGDKAFNALDRLKDDFIKEMFKGNPSAPSRLKKLFTTLRLNQKSPIAKEGSMLIQMKQAGAILQLGSAVGAAASGSIDGAALILFGPNVLGRLMFSRSGIEILTEGLKIKKGTQEATAFISRLMAHLTKENIDFELTDTSDPRVQPPDLRIPKLQELAGQQGQQQQNILERLKNFRGGGG